MELINDKILLSELAEELEVSHSALLQQLKPDHPSRLGIGATKFANKATNSWLLPIGSVLNYLNWAKTRARKIDKGKIAELEHTLSNL